MFIRFKTKVWRNHVICTWSGTQPWISANQKAAYPSTKPRSNSKQAHRKGTITITLTEYNRARSRWMTAKHSTVQGQSSVDRSCWVWPRRGKGGGGVLVSRHLAEPADWSVQAWGNSPGRFHILFPALGSSSHSPRQDGKSCHRDGIMDRKLLFIHVHLRFKQFKTIIKKQNLKCDEG